MLIIFALVYKIERVKGKRKEEWAFNSIVAGIGERLHASFPGSKWRWVCCPAGFAVNGGIARIEVILSSGKHQFIDVCLKTSGYMALHLSGASELTEYDNPVDGLPVVPSYSRGHKNIPSQGNAPFF
jgi:hypothetical protein